jgi:hypothetical protein
LSIDDLYSVMVLSLNEISLYILKSFKSIRY